jgi:(R)-amidase
VQALLAQLASRADDPAANAERVAGALARHRQADVAVFPELCLSGYRLKEIEQRAVAVGDAPLRTVAAAAARHGTAVVVGFAERPDGDGRPANAVAAFDRDGSLAAVYRKAQLFGAERDVFAPGRELVVAPLLGRRAGLLVCFDVEFPELARLLAVAGADLLVTVSANMAPFYGDHELATRARALENRLPHLYANCVGETRSLRFVGGSRSVGPDGSVLAEASSGEEELLLAPVGEAGADDERLDYLGQLPPPLGVVAP